jgi:23S rRNA (guanosine2251-2'-O)-methyltransferase
MPAAVVIGGEGNGLSELVRKTCDFLAHIPMRGEITSLNASVAAALVIYEAFKQRSR